MDTQLCIWPISVSTCIHVCTCVITWLWFAYHIPYKGYITEHLQATYSMKTCHWFLTAIYIPEMYVACTKLDVQYFT